jgi:FAD/FMN-containing dehydrogenase
VSWDRRRWTNWSGIQSVAPARHHDPDSLGELVALVREAESGTPPRRVRAVARGWAFSAVAVTADYLVETARLNRTLYDVLPRAFGAGRSADSERLLPNPGASATSRQGSPGTSCPCDWTRRPAWSSTPVPGNRRPPSLGMKTSADASGQTLGGAVSTGTHGAERHLAPLADSVRAIHLTRAMSACNLTRHRIPHGRIPSGAGGAEGGDSSADDRSGRLADSAAATCPRPVRTVHY